jgi:phospholipid/cholesterol/gamma-HCH transport system substrate-binding protein
MDTDNKAVPAPEAVSATSAPIRHLELKAVLLIVLTVVLMGGFLLYVFYARGAFDSTQRLVLMADDSEGVYVGMDLTFSGFPVGRVRRIELGEDGKVRIDIDVPTRDARWLRVSSVFTMERGLVGGTRLRAFTGDLSAPPLPDGTVRAVLRGDATEELPRLLSSMKTILANIEQMTAPDSHINASLGNVHTLTERMNGRYGALGGLLGGEENARKVIASIDRANALLGSLSGVTARLDRTLEKTDQRVFGAGGMMDEAQKAAVQLNAALGEARESLKKADAVLAEAQKIASNTRVASEDLGVLRAEVEASLRRAGQLIQEINRKWPFARDTEMKLP